MTSATLAQSTAFTYQGELKQGGTPASGTFDMRFRVYDTLAGGSQQGPTACVDNVVVSGGAFLTMVDVGAQFASISPRYLEIEVRSDTGLSCAATSGYTVLSPRQLISSVPRAAAASVANALAAPDGSPVAAVVVDNAGFVGIGTPTPGTVLHVITPATGATPGEGLRIQGTQPGVANMAYAGFFNSVGVRTGYVGDGSSGDDSVFLASDIGNVVLNTSGGRVLSALNDGSLRLGTASGDYRRFAIGGGNSDGFLFGSYPALGDGIHLGYNAYANAAGAAVVIHPDGGTSRISAGYGRISFAASGAFGGAPAERAYVDPSGLHVVPTERWVSVHGSAFVPRYFNTPSFGTQGGLQVVDSFGTGNSGTVGTPGSSGPGEFFAPLELPDGATLKYVCVDARDQHGTSDVFVSVGKTSLTTGQVTEVCTTFTGGSSSSIQHPCSVIVSEVVDNTTNVYFLKATMNTSGSNIQWLLAARVNYVVTSPLP